MESAAMIAPQLLINSRLLLCFTVLFCTVLMNCCTIQILYRRRKTSYWFLSKRRPTSRWSARRSLRRTWYTWTWPAQQPIPGPDEGGQLPFAATKDPNMTKGAPYSTLYGALYNVLGYTLHEALYGALGSALNGASAAPSTAPSTTPSMARRGRPGATQPTPRPTPPTGNILLQLTVWLWGRWRIQHQAFPLAQQAPAGMGDHPRWPPTQDGRRLRRSPPSPAAGSEPPPSPVAQLL